MAFARKAIGRGGKGLLAGGLLAAAVVFVAFALRPPGDPNTASTYNPCDAATTAGTGLAVFLFDFRKPLGNVLLSVPGTILRESAVAAPGGTELRVYALSGRTTMPLAVVGRACKPSLPDPASDIDCSARRAHRQGEDDVVAAFCADLASLQRRVNDLARQTPELPVPNALLVDAIEEVRLVFEARPGAGPRSFTVYSDMLQHAPWYSHLQSDGNWTFESFEDLHAERATVFGTPSAPTRGVTTEIYYVPRRGTTEQRTARDAHQRFWRRYFDSVGMSVVFRDQPTMPRFNAATLAQATDGLAQVVRERELLRHEQEENAKTLTLLEERRADLEQARQRAAASSREIEVRAAALRAEQARERQAIEVERAEIARLKAELASRHEDNDPQGL